MKFLTLQLLKLIDRPTIANHKGFSRRSLFCGELFCGKRLLDISGMTDTVSPIPLSRRLLSGPPTIIRSTR